MIVRTGKELEAFKEKQGKSTIILNEQENFLGTEGELNFMQSLERAYISGDPKASDEEWEILKKRYNYKETPRAESASGRKWVRLMSPLPSLDKVGGLSDLEYFLGKFDHGQAFITECKLDGLTANIKYKLENENFYVLDTITSAGNGRYGLELNPYALSGVSLNIPYKIPTQSIIKILGNLEENLEFRGEAVIPKNEHTREKYGKDAVLRSIASGMFNRKIPFNLKGVLNYIHDEYGIEYPTQERSLVLKAEFNGRKCVNPEVLESARLVASLFENKDPDKFMKYDEITIDFDYWVQIDHGNGNVWYGEDDGEELDFVIYSASHEGSNVDITDPTFDYLPELSKWFKTINNVNYESSLVMEYIGKFKFDARSLPGTVYMITNDSNGIWEIICNFYGCDIQGKRDFKKPRMRNLYEYAVDGIVIKPVGSDNETQNVLFRKNKNNSNKIVCPKYPEDQIAVKLLSEVVKVKLSKIEKTVTGLGNETCSGILDKAYLTESGAWVERINLHNPNWLKENNWIEEGGEYWMCMSLDIIPVLLNPKMFP